MRILVTGAAGMLGTDVCRALAGAHEVIATDITGNYERLDITDQDETLQTIRRFSPELVAHCAAYTDVDGCERDLWKAYRVNAHGTFSVAVACDQTNAAILYISTDYVFDGDKDGDYEESDQANPINAYGRSKLGGEVYVRDICKRYYIVRTAWLYGENGKNFVSTILNRASEGKELRVVADQVGSPTYTKDLAEFVASQVGSSSYGVYHVTNKGSCSWYELAVKAIQLAGIEGADIQPIASSEWPTPARRPKRSVLKHISLLMQGRDNLRSWEEALSEFVEKWTTARR